MLGIPLILFITWCFSLNRRAVNWRLVAGGLVLQVICALAFFQFESTTRVVIDPIASFFEKLTKMSDEGAKMVFGPLVSQEVLGKAFGPENGYIFAFRVLPTIIFFSALTSVLYYCGILQRIVFAMAWVMKRLMRISGAESLAAAGEVFLGQTESALLIKPYVPKMTRSEILTLMVGGMATIAGGVMAAYIGMLSKTPAEAHEIARNLLCASLMNAPAAIIISKILLPETEEINTDLTVPKEKMGANFFDALADGTSQGLKLALNIGAMLIAFIAVVALVDFVLGSLGNALGWASPDRPLSLAFLFSYIFAPVAKIIGVESWADCQLAGQLLGVKIALNEFVAYGQLGAMKGEMAPKTVFLMQFALCGFANLSSVGIQLGGITAICPEKRPALAALGFRALLGGTLATLLTASLAGVFFK